MFSARPHRGLALLVTLTVALVLTGCGGSEPQEQNDGVAAPDGVLQQVTTEPDATGTPEATEEPTAKPTDVPPTDVPPTEPVPTEPPPTDAPPPTELPPTAVPAPVHDPDPDQDQNCGDFPTVADAIYWWNYHRTAERPNPGRLDGDGVVCESLP